MPTMPTMPKMPTTPDTVKSTTADVIRYTTVGRWSSLVAGGLQTALILGYAVWVAPSIHSITLSLAAFTSVALTYSLWMAQRVILVQGATILSQDQAIVTYMGIVRRYQEMGRSV